MTLQFGRGIAAADTNSGFYGMIKQEDVTVNRITVFPDSQSERFTEKLRICFSCKITTRIIGE